MENNFLANKIVGYAQAAAASIDAQVLVSSFLPALLPPRTCLIRIKPEAQAVRIRRSTAPTAAVGYPIAIGETYELTDMEALSDLRIIGQAANAIVNFEIIAN